MNFKGWLQKVATSLDINLREHFNRPNIGFVLLVFNRGTEKETAYVTNARMEEVSDALEDASVLLYKAISKKPNKKSLH